jgi:UTP--glucose-1-phosphate uridylyltransferase
MIKRVVITAAGLGTRLLPMSKELPKEMLPVFVGENPILKPLLQALFEQLYAFGFRDFCFVVGRGKRAIEDHFTPDREYVSKLNNKGKMGVATNLESFYHMIEDSTIMWVNQPEPRGFGHAVLMSRSYVDGEPFMLCAGDTYVISDGSKFLTRMVQSFSKRGSNTLLLQKLQDPRNYGVAIVEREASDIYRVSRIVEKPKSPPSNLAVMPFYIFKPELMDILQKTQPGIGNEIQLTDAVQTLIRKGNPVHAVMLEEDEVRLDIGTPKEYWEAQRLSYEHLIKKNKK